MSVFFVLAIILAFFFAFWNGLSDAAYSISTIIATRVLSPRLAVLFSAVGNFTGLLFGTAVAQTIGRGIVDPNLINDKFLFSVLLGGLLWDISTWFFALPISESHVLVGSLIGAGLVSAGSAGVKFNSILDKVLVPMIGSPVITFIVAFLLIRLVSRIFVSTHPKKANRIFRSLQLISSFTTSVSHGANDGQKAMGIVTILLFNAGLISSFSVPLWVMLACYGLLSLGTLFGGWKIVKTMSKGITKLKPYQGFCSEAASTLVLFSTALIGFPVSTTQAVSGAIMGVGAARRKTAVHWTMARKIVIAWFLTMPASALLSGLIYFIVSRLVP
ncbi:MAG: inorganic phosphate transporter [Candidatus Shapirobacteria bacterium]|jgi:PiT family inorganic phosphate transporter